MSNEIWEMNQIRKKSKVSIALAQILSESENQWKVVENAIEAINEELHQHNPKFKLELSYSWYGCDVLISGKTSAFNMLPRRILTVKLEPLSVVSNGQSILCSEEELDEKIVDAMISTPEWPHYASMIRVFH
jgi:hypothetical protein